jgi:hypothetical protein
MKTHTTTKLAGVPKRWDSLNVLDLTSYKSNQQIIHYVEDERICYKHIKPIYLAKGCMKRTCNPKYSRIEAQRHRGGGRIT